MPGLPENTTYGTASKNPGETNPSIVSSNFKSSPSQAYKYLAQMGARGRTPQEQLTPPINPEIGTPEYDTAKEVELLRYGQNYANTGQPVPLQTQFLPQENPKADMAVPSDYGSFAAPATFTDNGEKLSWGTPSTPVIKNIQGDVPGQYVEDTSNPELLVKTIRGNNELADQAIRGGRLGFAYTIDHIMPLELGGADTLANRQVLTYGQNDQKTRAQAVPYTLYAYGQISLKEAREMAMRWKDRDLTDVPLPNSVGLLSNVGDKSGIEIAKETAARWSAPIKPAPLTLKGFMAQLPDTMKNLGEGILPDFVREGIKGFASESTLGFLPYEQDDQEAFDGWIGGKIGQTAGVLASFIVGGLLVKGVGLGIKGIGAATKSLNLLRGVAKAKIIESTAEATARGVGFTMRGTEAVAETGAKFKVAEQAPKYLSNFLREESLNNSLVSGTKKFLTSERATQMGKLAGMSALLGQGRQFVENKFNPSILSGQSFVEDAGLQKTMGRIATDLVSGAAFGAGGKNLGGIVYSMGLPLTVGLMTDPYHPENAIADAVIFGALHANSTFMKPTTKGKFIPSYGVPEGWKGIDSVWLLGTKGKTPIDPAQENLANRAAYRIASEYAPELYPSFETTGNIISKSAHDPVNTSAGEQAAIENIKKRMVFGLDAEKKQTAISSLDKFSKKVDETLGSLGEPEPLKGWSKFSPKARRERANIMKGQEETITKEFGKGYQTKNEISSDPLPIEEFGVNFQPYLAEIKRVKVAFRQLYKGGLVGDLRYKADADDLFSVTELNRKGRAEAQMNSLQPRIVKDIVDTIDTKSIFERTFSNESFNKESKYPNGSAALTGMAIRDNKQLAVEIMEKVDKGIVSRNFILLARPDWAPLGKMRNEYVDFKNAEAIKGKTGKDYAIDPHPEYTLQPFFLEKNPTTGQVDILPFPASVASEHRLNGGKQAINKWIQEKINRGENPGTYKVLEYSKDQLNQAMDGTGLDYLIVQLAPHTTSETIKSKNPYLQFDIKDGNWKGSLEVQKKLSAKPNVLPESIAIEKFNKEKIGKKTSTTIKTLKDSIVEPARAKMPEPEGVEANKQYKATETVLRSIEESLDVADPIKLKEGFLKNLEWNLTDQQATEIFNKRNELSLRDEIKMLVKAMNNGEIGTATDIKIRLSEPYLKSLSYTKAGRVALELPVLGKIKNPKLTGQEEHMITPTSTRPTVQSGETLTDSKLIGDGQKRVDIPSSAVKYEQKGYTSSGYKVGDKVKFYDNFPNGEPKQDIHMNPIFKEGIISEVGPNGDYFQVSSDGKPPNGKNFIGSFSDYELLPAGDTTKSLEIMRPVKKYGPQEPTMQPMVQNAEPTPVSIAPNASQESASGLADKITKEYLNVSKKTGGKVAFQRVLDSSTAGRMDPSIAEKFRQDQSIQNQKVNDVLKEYIPKAVAKLEDSTELLSARDKKETEPRKQISIHKAVISSVEKEMIDTMSADKRYTRYDINQAKKQFRDEMEGQSHAMLQTNGENLVYIKSEESITGPEDVQAPLTKEMYQTATVSKAKDFFKSIDEAIANKNSKGYFFNKALDDSLKAMVPDYRTNPELARVIDEFVTRKSANDKNPRGREITQKKDIAIARATKPYEKFKNAIAKRSVETSSAAVKDTSGSNKMSRQELMDRGISPQDLKEANIGTPLQEQDMIHNLTKMEDLMLATMSSEAGTPDTPLKEIRTARGIMFGTEQNPGLYYSILKDVPGARRSIPFDAWEAKVINIQQSPKIENLSKLIDKSISKYANILKGIHNPYEQEGAEFSILDKQPKIITDIEKGVSVLNTAKKLADDYRTGEPLPSGLTPEIVKDNVSDVIKNLNKAIKLMEETQDGGGGPGYINNGTNYKTGGPGSIMDGKGGIGDFFGGLWDKLKNGNTTTFTNEVKQPTKYELKNRGVTLYDTDFESLKPLLFSETSDRDFSKKTLESNVIYNTAINRMAEYSKKYGRPVSMAEVLSMPNQYQGYTHPNYKIYNNPIKDMDKWKKKEIDDIVDALRNKAKTGNYDDFTGGAFYYIHNPDKTIKYDNKTPLFTK